MKLYLALAFFVFALSVYPQTAIVISENANLRGTPSEKGKVVETIEQNTQIEVLKQKDAWFLVQTTDYVGWLHGNTIKLITTGGNATVTERANTVVVEPRYVSAPRSTPSQPRTTDGRTYYLGPRGGCYYLDSKGKKVYVDHDKCN